MIAIAIIGLVISVLTVGYSTAVQEYGSKVSKDGLELARDIANKISKNNAKLSEAYQAWNTKSSHLANSLFQGIGFGPRANAVIKAMDAENFNYKELIKQINAENVSLEQLQNDVQSAVSTSNSLSGAYQSSKAIEDAKAKWRGELPPNETKQKAKENAKTTLKSGLKAMWDKYMTKSSLDQNIQGGVVNEGERNV